MKRITLVLVLFALTNISLAEPVQIPIYIGAEFVRHQLVKQVFNEPDDSIEVWRDAGDCNSLRLHHPEVSITGEGVWLNAQADSRIGQLFADQCATLTSWSGMVAILYTPALDAERASVVLTIEDSSVVNDAGNAGVPGVVWNWIKKTMHPRMRGLRIDLNKPLQDLRGILEQLVLPVYRTRAAEILGSASFSALTPTPGALSLTLTINAAEDAVIDTGEPEPALTEEEMERFDRTLDHWDAFMTFVIKTVAALTREPGIRDELLEILLESRHEIVSVLMQDIDARAPDPIRVLFVDMWERLSPVLQTISLRVPGESAIHFISFITAGDALAAIDKLGPYFNVEISTFALRRLARLIAPDTREDPLQYDDAVDPKLRQLFDFGLPLPINKPEDASLNLWFVPNAHAQIWDDQSLQRLNTWVPEPDNIRPYLTRVRWLLEDTADSVLRSRPVEATYKPLFRPLVLAAAWQESCWRQYTTRDGKRWPVTSNAGALGMMQILPRVWRGFYESHHLAWDIGYNTNAGTEILQHYLVRYAIRHREHEKTQDLQSLARATYAAYNGGPRHLSRYRLDTTPQSLKLIDEAFWLKYQTVRAGNALGVLACYK